MKRIVFICSALIFKFSYSFSQNEPALDTIKVKVHDHEMWLYVSGQGKPTVILETGMPGTHKNWEKVQPSIAGMAKVICYDRPGYLRSDSCSSPRDATTIAKELEDALAKAKVPPPYLLVGWSFGGAVVRVFAGLYPKDVIGMLLIDPAFEDFYPRWQKEFPESLKEDSAYVKEVLSSKRIGERDEMKSFDSSMNQARRSDKYHSTPTTLLIAAGGKDRDTTDPVVKIWIDELEKWAKRRPNMEYSIIRNSGHHIAGQQPDIVIDAIRKLLGK